MQTQTLPSVRRRLRAVAVVAALMGAAGCATGWDQYTPTSAPTQTPTSSTAPTPPTPASPSVAPTVEGWIAPTGDAPTTLDGFYGQTITWGTCTLSSNECAAIWVPINWDDPAMGAATVAMARVKDETPGEHLGSMLINPGGPGGSGIDFLSYATSMISQRVLDVYDIVAFDPRGVNFSTPVSCGSDEELDGFFLTDVKIESQADLDAAIEMNKHFGQRCLEETGPLLGFVDTVSAAKDMDLMRALLGDDKLSYLGYSYGTQLGATYAGLFPENVGRLVLDGAIDLSLDADAQSKQQAAGFEQSFRAYVTDCMTSTTCPLTGTVDEGIKQIQDLIERARVNPLPTGTDEPLNGVMAYFGVIVAMYDDSSWPVLSEALGDAIQDNDGSYLRYLANFYLSRDSLGHYTDNSMEAFNAIGCLDTPMKARTYDELVAWRDEVAQVAPTVAEDFTMGTGCNGWPFPATGEIGAIAAEGAAPIVVIGTTGDPATPYEWSVAMASQLSSGVLLTYEGEGHTAYGRSNQCITDAVDQYFINGTVPADGTNC